MLVIVASTRVIPKEIEETTIQETTGIGTQKMTEETSRKVMEKETTGETLHMIGAIVGDHIQEDPILEDPSQEKEETDPHLTEIHEENLNSVAWQENSGESAKKEVKTESLTLLHNLKIGLEALKFGLP